MDEYSNPENGDIFSTTVNNQSLLVNSCQLTSSLPEETYYQIKDFASDDIIVPFSEFTKVSCDENGNYFNLNLSNWEAGRVYKLEFKVSMDGVELYFDEDITFTIVSK